MVGDSAVDCMLARGRQKTFASAWSGFEMLVPAFLVLTVDDEDRAAVAEHRGCPYLLLSSLPLPM